MQLDPLVKPRSVAIVGATDRAGPGRSVVESLGAIGFTGAIYPVNPKYQTVLNHVCYPSLTDLPEAPDVVVFSIRKPLLPEQVRLAVKRGARAAVIYDAGFAELGEDGARQQAEIAGLCREAGMRGLRAELHGNSQPDGAGDHLQADPDGHQRACRQCRASSRRADRSASRSCPICAATASACRSRPATRP